MPRVPVRDEKPQSSRSSGPRKTTLVTPGRRVLTPGPQPSAPPLDSGDSDG